MKIRTIILAFILALSGITKAQIPPGYYDEAQGLQGDELKTALHNIIDDHVEYSYDALRDYILKETDEDPNNSNNVILLYTGRSQSKSSFGGGVDDWNREHVWAKSHGDFGNTPPCGTDAHHIRPTDVSVNSSRGNLDFDEGGQQHPEAPGCYYDSDSWEPRDEVKGDVARMIFYMAVRYEGDNGEPDLEVVDFVNTAPAPEHGKFSTLLEWHYQDPPDDFEINRNEVIYSYQQNRNPFIDHPEYLDMIYNPSSIAEELQLKAERIIIYPNPASNQAFIQLPGIKFNHLTINDMSGRELQISYTLDQQGLQLNTSTLNKGIYLLLIQHDTGIFYNYLSIL